MTVTEIGPGKIKSPYTEFFEVVGQAYEEELAAEQEERKVVVAENSGAVQLTEERLKFFSADGTFHNPSPA